jgi:hypothetical protein
MADSYLLIDYVYLDSEERKRFAQASHEYLIEQVQFTGSESLGSSNNKYRLNFNHPSKYLIWAPHVSTFNVRNQWVSYATDGNWEAARERFAKIIAWISAPILTGGTTITAPSVTTVGAVNTLPINYAGSAGLKTLRDKVEARYIALTASATPSLGAGVTDILNNIIITKNSLTLADMSITVTGLNALIDALTLGGNVSQQVTAAKAFLGTYTQNVVNYHNYGMNLDGSVNPCVSAKLQLNGHDRFQERDGSYFNYVQPAQHFSNTPADGINVYSFALKAEDHQPTGSCNFSRIDNATLNITAGSIPASSQINVYVQNYNVLRVMSGMAGTAYSN